jgi:hypothetical protein
MPIHTKVLGELGWLKECQQGCLGQLGGCYSSQMDILVCVTLKFGRRFVQLSFIIRTSRVKSLNQSTYKMWYRPTAIKKTKTVIIKVPILQIAMTWPAVGFNDRSDNQFNTMKKPGWFLNWLRHLCCDVIDSRICQQFKGWDRPFPIFK